MLRKPSENNPVEYFSSVEPHLFMTIATEYMGRTDGTQTASNMSLHK